MTTSIIISICALLLFAYVFDISSARTKIPSVILLLFLGWGVKQTANFFAIEIPNLTSVLPILGTIGLILIVLEGSLELELTRSKLPFVRKSSLVAFIPIIVISFGLGAVIHYYSGISFKSALTNSIPLAIISSSIAIPSANNLISKNKEFITYESSLSDIFGVIMFNFIAFNDYFTFESISIFVGQIILIIIISFIATLGLAFLLSKIKHSVKFAPIILLVILIYEISKIYNLPALVFILLFGIFLGNLDELKHIKFIQRLRPEILTNEVHKFKDLTAEMAFLVRALFFLLFGFLIETSEIINTDTIIWAVGITASIFVVRFILLKIFKIAISPLLYIAPRGLITILLFLSIPLSQVSPLVNNSLILQVIIMTALVMMLGLIFNKKAVENSKQ
ncbi:cation:proton antiporter [Flavobacterium antarcticum]|uniref:cation:proton antiporter n=1 Tax=Flavobacterium antarcticum TaxID=271155 RepID=UPI0003B32F3D|nr:cation:proton antiporter [Flavobacterium antarcticum]